jgi:hypothetical protein
MYSNSHNAENVTLTTGKNGSVTKAENNTRALHSTLLLNALFMVHTVLRNILQCNWSKIQSDEQLHTHTHTHTHTEGYVDASSENKSA